MFDVDRIRKDFPIFERGIIYLDNAATTQKPLQVINSVSNFYKNNNSNVHRTVHSLGEEATELYEDARIKIAKFINAKKEEIIFTKNSTEGLNLIASNFIGKNILTTIMEHHSNFVPWQKCKMEIADINNDGTLNMEQIKDKAKNKDLLTVTHVSNTLGTVNDVKEISKMSHDAGSLCLIDGAQSVPHMNIDVKDIDCDFFAFSGHKMLGPSGVGVLYVKKELQENLNPLLYGGGMIKEVGLKTTTFADGSSKFEGGTPNIEGVIGLGEAVDYLNKLGMSNVQNHSKSLTEYAIDILSDVKGIHIIGPDDKIGIVSFIMKVHAHDVATIVNKHKICIRSGHNCTMPLLNRLNLDSVSRASFYIYNTPEEIDKLKIALNDVNKVFRL